MTTLLPDTDNYLSILDRTRGTTHLMRLRFCGGKFQIGECNQDGFFILVQQMFCEATQYVYNQTPVRRVLFASCVDAVDSFLQCKCLLQNAKLSPRVARLCLKCLMFRNKLDMILQIPKGNLVQIFPNHTSYGEMSDEIRCMFVI